MLIEWFLLKKNYELKHTRDQGMFINYVTFELIFMIIFDTNSITLKIHLRTSNHKMIVDILDVQSLFQLKESKKSINRNKWKTN